jgi:hypothetical protein
VIGERDSERESPIHPHLLPLIEAMRGKGRVFPVERVRETEGRARELRGHLDPHMLRYLVRAVRLRLAAWIRCVARSRRPDDGREALREGQRDPRARR